MPEISTVGITKRLYVAYSEIFFYQYDWREELFTRRHTLKNEHDSGKTRLVSHRPTVPARLLNWSQPEVINFGILFSLTACDTISLGPVLYGLYNYLYCRNCCNPATIITSEPLAPIGKDRSCCNSNTVALRRPGPGGSGTLSRSGTSSWSDVNVYWWMSQICCMACSLRWFVAAWSTCWLNLIGGRRHATVSARCTVGGACCVIDSWRRPGPVPGGVM